MQYLKLIFKIILFVLAKIQHFIKWINVKSEGKFKISIFAFKFI